MTITGFLQIPGIDGESMDENHEGQIDISAVSWGAVSPERVAGGGRPGRAQTQAFSFMKMFDGSSPALAKAAIDGTIFDEVRFSVAAVAATTGQVFDYLVIALSSVSIASYQLGTGDQQLDESLSLRAQKMRMTYSRQLADGTASQEQSVLLTL